MQKWRGTFLEAARTLPIRFHAFLYLLLFPAAVFLTHRYRRRSTRQHVLRNRFTVERAQYAYHRRLNRDIKPPAWESNLHLPHQLATTALRVITQCDQRQRIDTFGC